MRDRLFEEVERVLSAAEGLNATELSWTPSTNGTNSLLVLAAHTVGAAERHVVRTVGGGVATGTSDEEFAVRGDMAPIRARWDAVRRKIVETIDDMPPGRLDDAVPKPSRTGTIHGVLVHAIAHAAEHAGQAELTRDLIKERDAVG